MPVVISSLSYALATIFKYPKILSPLIAPFIVHLLMAAAKLGFIGSIVVSLISFIAYAVIIQCLTFIVEEKPVDLKYAWKTIYGKLDDIIVTSILATLLALTTILIPVALYSIVIAVVDCEKPVKSIMKALAFIIDNLKDVIVLLIIAIVTAVLAYILGIIIPLVGFIVFYALSLVISGLVCLAMAILYFVKAKKVQLKVFY